MTNASNLHLYQEKWSEFVVSFQPYDHKTSWHQTFVFSLNFLFSISNKYWYICNDKEYFWGAHRAPGSKAASWSILLAYKSSKSRNDDLIQIGKWEHGVK